MTDSALRVDEPARHSEPARRVRTSSAHVTLLFAATSFLGAALLFVVQPLVSKLLLPSYGGSPTVWSTSSLFFQVLLLLGYLYTHWATSRLGRTWQPRAHLLVLLLPLVALPVALPLDAAPDGDGSPVWWLLRTLGLMVGLPFVVVATTGPLLQKWYSWSDARRADDPYFLFAAGNLGSFGGLLAYPLLVEPFLTLEQQQRYWSLGFLVFGALTAGCAWVVLRSSGSQVGRSGLPPAKVRVPRRSIATWLGLAFLPSAMMLAVTAHVTTDIAAIPLLWVIPLALYLATFVAAFARSSRAAPVTATRVAVGITFATVVAGVLPGGPPLASVAAQMAMVAAVGYAAHARLAAGRPDPSMLTAFYLVISVGGALGGLLNGLVAPLLFDRVWEYPLVVAAVPLLLLGLSRQGLESGLDRWASRRPLLWSAILLVVATGAVAGYWQGVVSGSSGAPLAWTCGFLLAGILAYRFSARPLVMVAVLTLVFAGPLIAKESGSLDQRRTFFASYEVREKDGSHVLVHGTTLHGSQHLDERSDEPTTYYARSGPLGAVFGSRDFEDVAIIGLGVGTIAAYGEPGMDLTFFEIDPEIDEIARDPSLFTYLEDTPSENRTIVGDGRLQMEAQPDEAFDLIVLDAFSSDSIPTHLLTREAMRGYADKLSKDGLLVVHVSNRVFDLVPVVNSARADLGWHGAVGLGRDDDGAQISQWVVLGSDAALVDRVTSGADWSSLAGDEVLWTDDFSSVLTVLRW